MIDTYYPENMTQYERQVYVYGVASFYHVVAGMDIKTLSDYADEIEKVYDKNNPQVAEVCLVFRKWSKEMS